MLTYTMDKHEFSTILAIFITFIIFFLYVTTCFWNTFCPCFIKLDESKDWESSAGIDMQELWASGMLLIVFNFMVAGYI